MSKLTDERLSLFRSRVAKSDSCWTWTGTMDSSGYGRFYPIKGSPHRVRAHRVAYELFRGQIPAGLEVDHLCRNRQCVNPDHLEPVTRMENQRRGFSPSGINHRKTHCIRGHEFTPENTYRPADGRRICKACRASGMRAIRSTHQTQTKGPAA